MEEAPKGLNQEESQQLKCRYNETEPDNFYDTTELEVKLRKEIEGDLVAEQAMDLFLKSMFWHLVNYCEDNLSRMSNTNKHLFEETLVLLAPHLYIGNYTERVVKLIGDPTLITDAYFQNKELLRDMFFFSAVDMGKRGYSWCMTEIGVSIYRELNILDRVFHREEYDKRKEVNIRHIAYGGKRTEDIIRPRATNVWPNLPDAFTAYKWTKE
jgi:hypothetical protein